LRRLPAQIPGAIWRFHENAEYVRNHLDLYAAAPPTTVMPLKLVAHRHLSLIP